MTPQEFNDQFTRLTREWPKGYGKEKQAALHNLFREQPVEKLDFAITQAIKNSKYAPTLAEIEDQAINYRLNEHHRAKAQFRKEAEDFMSSRYHADDIKNMMGIIKGRMEGLVSDEDFAWFKSNLARIANEGALINYNCATCKDTRFIFLNQDPVPTVKRCRNC